MPSSRRDMLRRSGLGLGSVAMASLLAERSRAADAAPSGDLQRRAAEAPLAPRKPPMVPRAKRVIHLFMNGGPSQVDLFTPKPALKKFDGKKVAKDAAKGQDFRLAGAAMPSPFQFRKRGQAGIWMSELLPHLAGVADELCVVNSMQTDIPNHEQAFLQMNTGDTIQKRPSVGSWSLYGLGTENQSMPGFVVMCAGGMPTAATANWRSAFLPGVYQGMHVDTKSADPEALIDNVRNEAMLPRQQRRQLSLIQQMNRMHAKPRAGDPQLEARIESLELAFRMQGQALDAFDVRHEPAHVRAMYGEHLQGRQCLIARRLIERGVRYVQVYHGAGQPWDSHSNIKEAHPRLCREMDRPAAALIRDLRQRGLLDDTLVIWGGEMGRTPTVQLPVTKKVGRDHHNDGFTVFMAGGGVRAGYTHGRTDELGLKVTENPVHVHDLHATMLHLLGFDHEALTYRYAGRDFRLTDVHGRVVQELLA